MVRLCFTTPIYIIGNDNFIVTLPTPETFEYLAVLDRAGAVRYLYSHGRVNPGSR